MIASAGQALDYVASAVNVIFIAIVILMLAYYWTLDGPRTLKSFLLLVPQNRRESISELISAMESKIGFYIAGQGLLSLVVGIIALLAYLLIGFPNALVLALMAIPMAAIIQLLLDHFVFHPASNGARVLGRARLCQPAAL